MAPLVMAPSTGTSHVAVSPLRLATAAMSPPAMALWPCRVESLVKPALPYAFAFCRCSFAALLFAGAAFAENASSFGDLG